MRAIRQQDPDGRLAAAHDLSKLEAHYLAGERCDPAQPRSGRLDMLQKFRWSIIGGKPKRVGPSRRGFASAGLFPFRVLEFRR